MNISIDTFKVLYIFSHPFAEEQDDSKDVRTMHRVQISSGTLMDMIRSNALVLPFTDALTGFPEK